MDAIPEHTDQTGITQPPVAPAFLSQPYRTPAATTVRRREIRQLIEYTGRGDYQLGGLNGFETADLHLTLWQQATTGRPARHPT